MIAYIKAFIVQTNDPIYYLFFNKLVNIKLNINDTLC